MTTPVLVPITVTAGPRGVAVVAEAVADLVAGHGPAFAPVADPAAWVDPDPRDLPDDVAVVLTTSGSTGDPLPVLITRSALLTSARAGAEALGRPGHWLTAVPVTSAGGLLTVARAVLAGGMPIAWPGVGGAASFTAGSFADAGAEVLRRGRSEGLPAYVSLVPTQLTRILRSAPATKVLAGFSGVLLGGAALAPALAERARAAGVRLVITYGATETCGGVVYDGVPLGGVDVTVDDRGLISVGGPTIAVGYLGRPELTARRFAGGRFHSADLGEWREGRLHVVGRADQMIKVGAVTVSLAAIGDALRADSRVLDATVVALSDREWGQVPAAYVVPRSGDADEALARALADAVVGRLGAPARPRRVELVAELPTTAAGKPVLRAPEAG